MEPLLTQDMMLLDACRFAWIHVKDYFHLFGLCLALLPRLREAARNLEPVQVLQKLSLSHQFHYLAHRNRFDRLKILRGELPCDAVTQQHLRKHLDSASLWTLMVIVPYVQQRTVLRDILLTGWHKHDNIEAEMNDILHLNTFLT